MDKYYLTDEQGFDTAEDFALFLMPYLVETLKAMQDGEEKTLFGVNFEAHKYLLDNE